MRYADRRVQLALAGRGLVPRWRDVMGHGRILLLPGLVLAVSSLLTACAQAALDYPRNASWALSSPEVTWMGRGIVPHVAAQPTRSGFCLQTNGPDGLVTRLALVNAAERTLDAQCFLIDDDVVGNLLLDRMLAAAERGVRVRLLIDDWNLGGQDHRLAGVDAQPNFEVRIYNPVGSPRWFSLTRPLNALFGPRRILNRMHNKAFIVDNSVAIVGGRNIADAYFTASDDYNFGDMDILAVGPVANRVSMSFDEFWNDRLAVPIEAFVSRDRTPEYAEETRRTLKASRDVALSSEFASYLRESDRARAPGIEHLPLIWEEGEMLCDSPAKVIASMDENPLAYMVLRLKQILDEARTEVIMITPYLVPGEAGLAYCRELRKRGVDVKILTNSLASTDEVAPHGAYRKYRIALLRCGVELYETRPEPRLRGKDRRDNERSRAGSGLHAKSLIVDRKVIFVGSLNSDLRSVQMDTQNGVVVRSTRLAEELAAVFANRTSSGYAYRVRLLDGADDDSLTWSTEIDGKSVEYTDEPLTGPWRRFTAWFTAWLLPESWM